MTGPRHDSRQDVAGHTGCLFFVENARTIFVTIKNITSAERWKRESRVRGEG